MEAKPSTAHPQGNPPMCITTHASASGAFRVLVVNRSYIGPSVYIGRKWSRDAGSVLANPRSLHAGLERGETIAHYRCELRAALDRTVAVAHWNGRVLTEPERAAMRAEMKRLFSLLSEQRELTLRCFCAPEACHGDEIAAVLLEELERWLMRASRSVSIQVESLAA
jgi:hypothetical protein